MNKKKKHIVFTDVIGVLVSRNSYKKTRSTAWFGETSVAALNDLTKLKNADIVVCGASNHVTSLDAVRDLFNYHGVQAKVVGLAKSKDYWMYSPEEYRVTEIMDWVTELELHEADYTVIDTVCLGIDQIQPNPITGL
jgi:hypothetical protein